MARHTIIEETCASLTTPNVWEWTAKVTEEVFQDEASFKLDQTAGLLASITSSIPGGAQGEGDYYSLPPVGSGPFSIAFIVYVQSLPVAQFYVDFTTALTGSYGVFLAGFALYLGTIQQRSAAPGGFTDYEIPVLINSFYEYTFSVYSYDTETGERKVKVYRAPYSYLGGAERPRTYLGEFTIEAGSTSQGNIEQNTKLFITNSPVDPDWGDPVYLADLRIYTYDSDSELPGSEPPTIISFDPNTGPVGTTVTITGTNFNPTPADNTVMFNGIVAAVISSTVTEIVAFVPVGGNSGTITVETADGTGTSAASFTVIFNPQITMIR